MDSDRIESSDAEEQGKEIVEGNSVETGNPEKTPPKEEAAGSESSQLPEPQSKDIEVAPAEDLAQAARDEPLQPAVGETGVSTFKKILLWAAIGVAGLFFVLGLANIIGAWAANTPLTNTILAILEPIDNTLQRLEVFSGEAAISLSEASTSLDAAEQRVQELGAGLTETSLVVEALNRILEADLEQEFGQARDGIRSLYDTVVAVEETIEAINAIPFVNVEVPGSDEMAAIRTGMEEMAASAEELRQENQRRREERAQNLVTALTMPLNRLNNRVDEMQTRVTNAESRFRQGIERMDILQDSVPRWIDLLSITTTLVMAWLMFSQAAVIVLCWRALHPEPDGRAAL